jgi:hypothetical protein
MLLLSFRSISQNTQANTNDIMETIITSGNNATGSSGSVTYSIGQLFYTYIGESVYNVAQGIQHQEIFNTENPPGSIDPDAVAEIFIFPNPTTDFVNVKINGLELQNGEQSFQLYDFQGRLLKQNKIEETETQINLNDLSSSIYILKVNVNNKYLKTFKIIKK